METLSIVLQVVIALGIVNVWLVRSGRSTPYRPEGATSLAEEFDRYGLPGWVRQSVGAAKLALAAALVIGVFVTPIALPAAALVALLMAAAIGAHVRVGDPWIKSMPASLMLAMSAGVAFIQTL